MKKCLTCLKMVLGNTKPGEGKYVLKVQEVVHTMNGYLQIHLNGYVLTSREMIW